MQAKNKDKKSSLEYSMGHTKAVIINKKGRIKFISPKLASFLRYTTLELLGENAISVLIDDDYKELVQSQLDILNKLDSFTNDFDVKLKRKIGETVKIKFSLLKLTSEAEQTEDIALLVDEHTISKKELTTIADPEHQLAELVDTAKEVVLIINIDQEITAVNEIGRQNLGIRTGMLLEELLEPTVVKKTESFLVSLRNLSSSTNINLVLVHPKTKQRFYLAGKVSSINEESYVQEFRFVLHDITEQIKTEKAKELYYAIANHSIHSSDLNELYYNIHKELKQIVDADNMYIALEEEGEKGKVLSFPYYQDISYNPLKKLHRAFGKGLTEYVITNKEPKLFTKKDLIKLFEEKDIEKHGKLPELWMGVPLKVQSEVMGAIVIQSYDNKSSYTKRDLRLLDFASSQIAIAIDMVRTQEKLKSTNKELIIAKNLAEASLMVKDQFLANMSHEIRTPLNGIIGVIDLLEQTALANEQNSYLKTIKASSETLLNILNDILDLSKIEAGKMRLRPTPISPKQLEKKLKALFAPRAAINHINLKFHTDKNLPEVIEVDETRLIQVISNLLANSLKFTPRGGSIDISAKVKEAVEDNLIIRVDVCDSGIGIKKEDVDKLFTSFTQLDESTTKSYGGTGLGLSISKQLVEIMGGEIGVYSNPGFGSTFWFTIKARRSEKKYVKEKEEKDVIEIIKRFENISPRILVVDDNLVNRDVAAEILKKCGCTVDIASNGIEAVEKVKTNDYDIVFMDIQMPEMDGIEANLRIKELDIEKQPVVVAMTAYSMEEDRNRFLAKGLDDYLAKPIRANQIISKVESIFFGTDDDTSFEDTSGEDVQVLNPDIVSQLQEYGGKEMVFNIMKEFEEEAKTQIEECYAALEKNDYETISKTLHTLKGSAGTLGIEKVALIATEIESDLKVKEYSSLKERLLTLSDNFAEFKKNFNNILSHY